MHRHVPAARAAICLAALLSVPAAARGAAPGQAPPSPSGSQTATLPAPKDGVITPRAGRVDPRMPVVRPRVPGRTPVIRPPDRSTGGGTVIDPR